MFKLFVYISFIAYVCMLLYLLFFSNYRNAVSGLFDYNLIPFKSIVNYFTYFNGLHWQLLTDNFFGNILAFVPLGIFIPAMLASFRNHFKIIVLASISSLFIEIMQIVLLVGTFDIDDIILNTLGGWIGYVTVFCLIQRLSEVTFQSNNH